MSSPRPPSDVSSAERDQPPSPNDENDTYHSHDETQDEAQDEMYREQYSRGSSPYHNYDSPHRHHGKCLSCGSGSEPSHGLRSPPPLSSPSIASSLSYSAPGSAGSLHRRLSRSTLHGQDDEHVRARRRKQLSQRLSFLAQQLTTDDELDESMLGEQVDELERAFAMSTSPKARAEPFSPRTPERNNSRSYLASPISSLVRSQMSQLSMQSMRDEEEKEEVNGQQDVGMTVEQAKKVMAEAEKLNEEMNTIFTNLRARQEEADHVNALLVEGAERAAQRITFLQSRIAYLEQELYNNDDELQHLRICLKAVEVQLPPHPDRELQRCIQVFKQDYNSLKQKRAFRSSLAMTTMTGKSPDTTTTSISISPSRSKPQLRR